jgi:hypothetical protein
MIWRKWGIVGGTFYGNYPTVISLICMKEKSQYFATFSTSILRLSEILGKKLFSECQIKNSLKKVLRYFWIEIREIERFFCAVG